ncbi:MAG: hypothetical protein WCT23_08510 [Candidatus Neomarinimicrobiota bacterium]
MSIKQFTISVADLSKDQYLRNDEKYHFFLSSSDWNLFDSKNKMLIPLRDILIDDYNNFKYEESEEYKGIPTGRAYLDEDGGIKGFKCVSEENHPGRLKYKATNENILISSLRLAKAPALYFENTDLSEYVFSNGFYIYKVRDGWNRKFVLYILRTKKLKNVLDNYIYRGIGISGYKDSDLKKIKIPFINIEKQHQATTQIEPVEKAIGELKSQILSPQEAINKVFAREAGFDLEKVRKVDNDNRFYCDFSQFVPKNSNIRFSYRWNQLERVQEELYRNNKDIQLLGDFIKSTKNGWSPECNNDENGQAVLGIDAIQKTGKLDFGNPKFTKQTKGNIADFMVKDRDFFVSRGNTTDLVAMASVAEIGEDGQDYIYPDLMIKVEFDEREIDKEYIAFLFNSVIGRTYFKYSAKGKNQTMVKISAKELCDFRLPVPIKSIQQKIVNEIKVELEKQENVKRKIETERNKIDEIIEKAIA